MMTSKELTYQDIVKLRKQMQENNRNFYEQPIVITYQQAIQIENECLALEQENEKLKKVVDWIKHTFEITLDSKVRISDGIDCIQAFPIDLKTNEVIYELLKEVLDE